MRSANGTKLADLACPQNCRYGVESGTLRGKAKIDVIDPLREHGARISYYSSEASFPPLSKYSFEPIRCLLLSQGAGMKRRDFIGILGAVRVAGV